MVDSRERYDVEVAQNMKKLVLDGYNFDQYGVKSSWNQS